MQKKVLMICAALTLVSSLLLANKNHFCDRYLGHFLQGVALFNGDKYGDFKNDLVAVLSDHSTWKIHSKDRDIFSQWHVGDPIRMRVRTSFYWFKREHKFELVNEVRKETVRAMIIHYGNFHHQIVGYQRKLVSCRMGIYRKIDPYGHVQYHYYPVFIYKTILQLEDGSHWITEDGCHFKNEEKAYVFVDQEDGIFILITGHEREAAWQQIILESFNPS